MASGKRREQNPAFAAICTLHRKSRLTLMPRRSAISRRSGARDPILAIARHSNIGFTAAALLLFLLWIWVLPSGNSDARAQFLDEVLRQYGYVSSGDQRHAHLITLLTVAVFSAISVLLSRGSII